MRKLNASTMNNAKTLQEYDEIVKECRTLFSLKLQDYGPSWRIMRLPTVNDQLFIKVKRIREIEQTGVNLVDESIKSSMMAVFNYSIIGIIQAHLGFVENVDMDMQQTLNHYDQTVAEAKALMCNKNHDYDEAWREMNYVSLTDIILTKILRNKSILKNNNKTIVSEGVEGNFVDMANYAVFYLIKLAEGVID